MASTRTIHRSFAGGEVSPEMFGRQEDTRYLTGLARCRNMIVRPSGQVQRRPGFKYVNRVKAGASADAVARLFPFTYSTDQTMVVEIGVPTSASGTATAVSATTMVHSGAGWTGNQWKGYVVECGGSVGSVTSNTNDTLTIGSWWPSTPAVGAYKIALGYARFHTDGATLSYSTNTYRPNGTFTQAAASVNTVTGEITLGAAHSFVVNDPVEFTSDVGTLPTGLSLTTTYYIRTTPTGSSITVSATVGGSIIVPSDQGSVGAQHRVNYDYDLGDLATYSGTTYYCRVTPVIAGSPSVVPGTNVIYWYPLPASIYEIPIPVAEVDLFSLHYTQSNDVMTFVHRNSTVRELRRLGATEWTYTQPAFGAVLSAPGSAAATATYGDTLNVTQVYSADALQIGSSTYSAHGFIVGDDVRLVVDPSPTLGVSTGNYVVSRATGSGGEVHRLFLRSNSTGAVVSPSGNGAITATIRRLSMSSDAENTYKVTAVDASGSESVPSSAASPSPNDNNLYVKGAYNTITWGAVTGASRYRVYKLQRGLYGFIGETEALTFKDGGEDSRGGIAPDMGITPPIADTTLTSGSDYGPRAVCHFEQRRCFGGWGASPQSILMTRSGTESDLTYHIPVVDTDRISFAVASRESSTIRHLVPLDQLLVFTNSAEYRVTPVDTDAITPSSIAVRPQSYIGANEVQPLVVNRTVLFCAARGGHVRETGFNQDAGGYLTGDLSLRAAHLFDDDEIVDAAYMKAPLPIAWFVNDAGLLLGLTYVPEEQIGAWHWHDTGSLTAGDTFESCCVVSEDGEDRLYVVVTRTVNGSTVRYIERMGSLAVNATEDCFFVDAGSTYDSTATTTISGATQLAAEAVSVLADGLVVTGKTVSAAGVLTLTTAASTVQFGLPYTSEIQTLPFSQQLDPAMLQGRVKNVTRATVRVSESGKFDLGPTAALVRSSDPRNTWLTTLKSEPVEVVAQGQWTEDGQVYVRQTNPLPLTVTSLVLEVAIGGD